MTKYEEKLKRKAEQEWRRKNKEIVQKWDELHAWYIGYREKYPKERRKA